MPTGSAAYPPTGGGRGSNQLSWFNKWKILDNLRRSLIPAASLALLAASWLTSVRTGWICTLVVVTQLFFQTLALPFATATTRRGLKGLSPSKIAHDLLRTVAEASLIPHQAVAGRERHSAGVVPPAHLAQAPAAVDNGSGQGVGSSLTHLPAFLLSSGLISLLSGAAGWALHRWAPTTLR